MHEKQHAQIDRLRTIMAAFGQSLGRDFDVVYGILDELDAWISNLPVALSAEEQLRIAVLGNWPWRRCLGSNFTTTMVVEETDLAHDFIEALIVTYKRRQRQRENCGG